ncbi:hypothetical protein LOK49_LG15G00617 [Camellia lanceoleosa]|uniref:Uncharacterized protein n=1 Tax=Camellia lanceoleosa TaxID=1840588 RepID=A0ACC0F684_9ERIC|nr:hypothetical protein LOK49_LG15G00617 [Camellia lanceoleosa]
MVPAFLGDVCAWRSTRWRLRFFVRHQLSNCCNFKRLRGNENQKMVRRTMNSNTVFQWDCIARSKENDCEKMKR